MAQDGNGADRRVWGDARLLEADSLGNLQRAVAVEHAGQREAGLQERRAVSKIVDWLHLVRWVRWFGGRCEVHQKLQDAISGWRCEVHACWQGMRTCNACMLAGRSERPTPMGPVTAAERTLPLPGTRLTR